MTGSPQSATENSHELVVSRYFADYVGRGKPGFGDAVRHPRKTLGVMIALRRLPCLRVSPSRATAEGVVIRAEWSSRSRLARVLGFATGVLSLPDAPGQYSLGASKQTLRRKIRVAQRLGVHWAEVNDPQERQDLLKLAQEYEQTHPDETYRNQRPDNSNALDCDHWLAAYSADGRPLLVSVSPIDGEFAFMRYFRTIGFGDEQSNARYLMTDVLVEYLVSHKVRYLIDGEFTPLLPPGIRHFQQMLGFHIARIQLT